MFVAFVFVSHGLLTKHWRQWNFLVISADTTVSPSLEGRVHVTVKDELQ